MRRTRHRRPTPAGRRTGVVTVEFALVAPLVFLVVFAAVEFARLNMLVNTLENAAYEGARRGITPGATTDKVESEASAILETVGAVNGDVAVEPASLATATDVTVTIRVPLDDNAWLIPRFTGGVVLERSCTLMREQSSL